MYTTRLGSPNDPRPFPMQFHHQAKSPPFSNVDVFSGFRESLPVGYSLFYNWKTYI